ncbi:MAG: acyl-CoA thioesterase, partial [Succinivibrio sp.]
MAALENAAGSAPDKDAARPAGELLLRTLAMPADANPAGDIFGGWIMSQMDIAGSLLARDVAGGRIVTCAVDGMAFLSPVRVGDVVCCYGACSKIGRTSVTVSLELWVRSTIEGSGGMHAERRLVTRAHYVYVHVGATG